MLRCAARSGKHLYKYLQIRSLIYSQIKTTLEPLLSTTKQLTVKKTYTIEATCPCFIIYYYQVPKKTSLSYLSAWKNDLHLDISVEDWEKTCLLAQTQTINTRCKLLHCKWLFRTYITPVKLHCFSPSILCFIACGAVENSKRSGGSGAGFYINKKCYSC